MTAEPLVKDYMDEKFITINENDTINKAIRILMKHGLIGLLVVDDQGTLVGKLSEKDCLHVFVHQTYHTLPAGKVKDHMKAVERTIPSSMTARELADIFLNSKTRRLAVVDQNKLVGQITRRDLTRGLHLHFFPDKGRK